MKNKLNTDYLGGIIVLAVAGFFWSQMDEFTHFAAYFPERIIPILIILGVIMLIKGKLHPTMLDNFINKINANMLFAVLTGLAWVLVLEYIGFILSSFIAISVLLIRYQPKEKRTAIGIGKMLLLAGAEIAVMYIVFVKFLYVNLPVGRIFY